MKRARLVIGRKEGTDVRIPVASVSREHCELRVEDGKLMIRDLGSSNGTYVNRQRIQEQQVSAGDLIGVGPAVFVARIEGNPQTVDSAKAYAAGSAPQAVAATGGHGPRPASPTSETRAMSPSKPGAPKPAAKAKPPADEVDEFDLRTPGDSSDSSISDLDFDFLDEEDDDKKKL